MEGKPEMKFARTSILLAAAAAFAGCASTDDAQLAEKDCKVCCAAEAPEPTPELNFIHMADSQFGFYDYDLEFKRYKKGVEMINADAEQVSPAFMIMCGDMVNKPTAEHDDDFLAASAKLNIPYYVVAGNHDWTHNPQDHALYREKFGADYYTIDAGAYCVIVVNTNLWKDHLPGMEEMDAWFKAELEKAKAEGKIIIVAGHSPIFLKSADEAEEYFNLPVEKREEILQLLKDYDVIAYLGGHCHTRLDNIWEGIRFLHAETTSTNFDNRPYGYRLILVKGRNVYDSFVEIPANPDLAE